MYTFEQVAIAVGVMLAAVGAYNIVSTAVRNWREQHAPADALRAKVEEHGQKLDNDHRRLTTLEEVNALQLKALLQLITHELDGNHVDKLAEVRDEIQNYLIER